MAQKTTIIEKSNQFGLKSKLRPYKCTNCGHEKEIDTNHTGECVDVCVSCSNNINEGEVFKIPALGDANYRKFIFVDNE